MRRMLDRLSGPGGIGLACAAGAVAVGIAYLAAAGAPMRHVAINLAAFAVGLAAFATIVLPRWRISGAAKLVLPLPGLVLVATALLGTPVDGAARWVALGPLNLQFSLILLPAMIVLFARRPDAAGAAGLALAALGLALQPDRAMAGALAASLLVLALCRRERTVLAALAAALAGFAATLVQADHLPAVPYVDRIFYSSFDIHPALGLALIAGACLLVLPAMAGGGAEAEREERLVFGALWLAILIAAALGNYPTPLLGYGGSAIVGYLLSLSLLHRASKTEGAGRPARGHRADERGDPSLSISLA